MKRLSSTDVPTEPSIGAKKLGHGTGYAYPPNDPSGYDVDCLPDELKGSTFYEPSGSGEDTA